MFKQMRLFYSHNIKTYNSFFKSDIVPRYKKDSQILIVLTITCKHLYLLPMKKNYAHEFTVLL